MSIVCSVCLAPWNSEHEWFCGGVKQALETALGDSVSVLDTAPGVPASPRASDPDAAYHQTEKAMAATHRRLVTIATYLLDESQT